jgi:membrane-bound lytic murein transglycosylase MltF
MRWPLTAVLTALLLAGSMLLYHGCERTPDTEHSLPPERGAEEAEVSGSDEAEAGDSVDVRAEQRLLDLVRQPWVGDLDGMLERRLIRVLTVPSRTMYFLEKGTPRGIVSEFQVAFEAFINQRFPPWDKHLKPRIVVVLVQRDELLPALLDGRGDIAAANLTITPGREAQVDFSAPTSKAVDEILVTGPSSPAFASLDELAGKPVWARQSSSYWEHLQEINARFRAEGKTPIKIEPVPEELQDEDLMEMVNAGLLETVVVDDYKAELWAKVLPEIRLHPGIVINAGGRFGWMMRKGSPMLEETVNAFVEGHKAGTSFGNTVIQRYLGSSGFVKRATAKEEVQKLDRVADLFRRFGDRYDLDHLLLLAQGYQESRLDHKARSRAGAVGIMQVLPSTGKELGVGDVRELEANVHAGAKYLRTLLDTYFNDDAVDDLNKMLFAFAAYNAGPNRILRLRRAAGDHDLNPNLWFGNVELLVAREVGPEPVSYVSNIFKYYVAYKLLAERQAAQSAAKQEFKDKMQ